MTIPLSSKIPCKVECHFSESQSYVERREAEKQYFLNNVHIGLSHSVLSFEDKQNITPEHLHI